MARSTASSDALPSRRGPGAGIGRSLAGLTPFTAAVPELRALARDYHRSPDRPEYRVAFDDFMEALADPALDEASRQAIAHTLVEQHMRREGTIAPDQVNDLVEAMQGDPVPRGHTTRPLPENIGPERLAVLQSVAAAGYRIDEAGRARLAPEHTAESRAAVSLRTEAHAASLQPLTAQALPVALRTREGSPTLATGIYGFQQLRQHVQLAEPGRARMHPTTGQAALTPANLSQWAVRLT